MAAPTVHGVAPAADAPPQLSFAVERARALEHAAVPTIAFDLNVERAGGGPVRSLALDTQIRIAAPKRPYDAATKERLSELFGRGDQWGRNLRGLLWTNVTAQVPPFSDATGFELQVPCTYDFELSAARYFHAVEEGEVPLELLFSGTVFYAGRDGRLQVARIPWDREAEFRLPVAVWREVMELHFPGTAWLRIRRDAFDRLQAYKARRSLATWEDALDALLPDEEEA